MASLETLLKSLLDGGGSDLILCAGAAPQLRCLGELRPAGAPASAAAASDAMIREAIGTNASQELEETGEAETCRSVGELGRFRFSAFRAHQGLGALVRRIPEKAPPLQQLGLPPALAGFARLRRGLVLIGGGTGSGKTTTLASLIDEINSTRCAHVITLERPIEIEHVSKTSVVAQREIGRHTSSIPPAVTAAAREGADVLAIGELEDSASIVAAVEASSRGHLVLAVLCANSAVEALERLLAAWPAAEQPAARAKLAANLNGIAVQTLLRGAEGVSRVPAVEVLLNTGNLPNLIRDGKLQQAQAAMQSSGRVGMSTLCDSIVRLVVEGKVDSREALQASLDREGLLRGLRAAGVELEAHALTGA